jgi:hypothetical protein
VPSVRLADLEALTFLTTEQLWAILSAYVARGAVAQMGERYNRTVEVRGSNPLSSTSLYL